MWVFVFGPFLWCAYGCPFLFSIILLINREDNCRRVAACVLCLFLVMTWVGMQSVIVAFPGHTLLLF